jgi:hypothetical protein
MDRSDEDRLKASGPLSGATKGTTKRQRPSRSTTPTSTSTLLVVLLGLSAVGQIFFVIPDPALITTQKTSSSSSSSTTSTDGSDQHHQQHPLSLNPAAWKVSHHLAKHQVATTTLPSLYNEILGAREPPSQGKYEIVLTNESSSPSLEHVKEATPSNNASTPMTAAANSSGEDPLLTLLQKAGLTDIPKADLATLPTWEQLTRQYGDLQKGPTIVGMESCERYRQQVHKRHRYAAPAGMFNTGTNAAAFHLEHNLQALQKWQVPWGKHRMESVRLTHTAPSFEKASKQDAMPIVMIRDPLHWMQSMVRELLYYTALYFTGPLHLCIVDCC